MRILHVSDSYPPVIGGLERCVRSLAVHQAATGHDVAVLTASHPDAPEHTDEDGVLVVRAPLLAQRVPGALADPARPFHVTTTDPLFRGAAARLLDDFRPDLVHAHAWSLYSVLGPARRRRVPVVMTAHDYGQVCALKTLLRSGSACPGPAPARCLSCAGSTSGPKGLALAAGLQVSSRRHRQVAAWIGLSSAVTEAGSAPMVRHRDTMRVIPSFVPDHALDLARASRPAFLPEGPYLLFVGALGPHKGLSVLLEAYGRLRSADHTLPLVCIGTPRTDTPDLDLPGVIVATDVPHPQVMGAWRDATVGVVPSLWAEPFGQVAVEALAAGTPLVVSASGGLTDIVVDGEHGLLVPPGDPVALAETIGRMLDDPDLRARLAAAGPARARRFTLSAVAHEIEDVYAQVLQQP